MQFSLCQDSGTLEDTANTTAKRNSVSILDGDSVTVQRLLGTCFSDKIVTNGAWARSSDSWDTEAGHHTCWPYISIHFLSGCVAKINPPWPWPLLLGIFSEGDHAARTHSSADSGWKLEADAWRYMGTISYYQFTLLSIFACKKKWVQKKNWCIQWTWLEEMSGGKLSVQNVAWDLFEDAHAATIRR